MTEGEAIKPARVNDAGLETSNLGRNIGKVYDLRLSVICNPHVLVLSPFPALCSFLSFPSTSRSRCLAQVGPSNAGPRHWPACFSAVMKAA